MAAGFGGAQEVGAANLLRRDRAFARDRVFHPEAPVAAGRAAATEVGAVSQGTALRGPATIAGPMLAYARSRDGEMKSETRKP